MSNDIKVTMTSDQRQLMADFIKQQEALQKTSQKFVELGVNAEKALRKAQNEITTTKVSFTNILPSLSNMAAGYLSATTVINTFITAQRQAQEEATATGKKFDELFRNLQITAGLTDLQKAEAQSRVLNVAEKVGVTSEFAGRTAKQLISSDFSVEQATGSELQTTLEGLSAATARGQDPAQTVKAMSQFIDALGMDKSEGNARAFLRSMTNLQSGASEIIDASQISGKVQGFRGLASPDELLASFEIMRRKTSAEVASTSLKILGERLTTVTGSKERVKALNALGLKPEDVDFKGENISQVLDRVASGAGKMSGPKREGVLADLFGTEALPGIKGLIEDRGQMAGIIALMNDEAKFQGSVRKATEGRISEANRQEVRRERLVFNKDTGVDIAASEVDNSLIERASPFGRMAAQGVFRGASFFGATPEQAAFVAGLTGGNIDTARVVSARASQAVGRAIDPERAAEEQARIDAAIQKELKEANDYNKRALSALEQMARQRPPVAPPPKPPSAALGAKR